MAKTWDTSRTGGGTYEFTQDAQGNYTLGSVGFDKISKLNLPELKKESVATTTTTDKKDTAALSSQTKQAFGDVQPFYYNQQGGGGADQFVYIFCTANATLRISAFQRAAITVGRKSMFNCGYLGGQSSPGGMCRKRLGQHGSPGIGMTESNKFYIPREQLRHHNSCFIRLGSRSGKKTFLQISWCNVFQSFS